MADVTVTAADVRPLPGAVVRRYDAGGTVTPGQAVYLASDGDVEAADADAAASARVIGIAVAGPDGKTSFSAGDRVDVVTQGPVCGFSSLTPGGIMYTSVTAGSIADAAATAAGDYIWVIGYAEAASTVYVDPWTYDIAVIS
jgi:hypothetical protein